VKGTFAQKIHEQDVESWKKWLCDTHPINVQQGLDDILSPNNPPSVLKEMQIRHLGSKQKENILFATPTIRNKDGFEKLEDMIKVDDTVTLLSNFNIPGTLGSTIKSRPHFVKLIFQYLSYFPVALLKAYTEITGENLILDDLSEVREFYESCSKFDLWTGHELCSYISHCDPGALDFISEHSEAQDLMAEEAKNRNFRLDKLERLIPSRFSRIFLRPDLYEKNLPLVKAAILGGAFELIHLDHDNWAKSSLKPKKGLEWAKKKGIGYHPILNEYLLTSHTEPAISSEYTTPYLEMMREVIRELEISRENQSKKEAITAIFEKKLADHKATPSSRKLANAMATLVRLPESQQGRAKYKGVTPSKIASLYPIEFTCIYNGGIGFPLLP
jgi:hypothetical protein